MKNRSFTKLMALPIAAALMLSISACSSNNSAGATTTPTKGTIVYGKVTAVSGSNITLSMGTISMPDRQNSQNSQSPQSSQGSQNAQSSPSSSPSGSPSQGGRGGSLSFTESGETKTITVSDTSILKKQERGGGRQGGQDGQGMPSGSPGSSPSSSPNSSASASPKPSGSPMPSMDQSKEPGDGQGLASETSASLSDITVGSLLRITYQGDTITSIVILSE